MARTGFSQGQRTSTATRQRRRPGGGQQRPPVAGCTGCPQVPTWRPAAGTQEGAVRRGGLGLATPLRTCVAGHPEPPGSRRHVETFQDNGGTSGKCPTRAASTTATVEPLGCFVLPGPRQTPAWRHARPLGQPGGKSDVLGGGDRGLGGGTGRWQKDIDRRSTGKQLANGWKRSTVTTERDE